MKERILKVMEKEGLTSSRFAEAIGIQRSAMSHIISGRNKLLSLKSHPKISVKS